MFTRLLLLDLSLNSNVFMSFAITHSINPPTNTHIYTKGMFMSLSMYVITICIILTYTVMLTALNTWDWIQLVNISRKLDLLSIIIK